MSENPTPRPEPTLPETLRSIEQRLTRLEKYLHLPALAETASSGGRLGGSLPTAVAATGRPEEELEFVVGQNWFASVGILVLTCGIGFALSLPLAGLPSAVPSLIGCGLAVGLLLIAHFWQKSFELVAGYFRGAGMALLYFSALRLFFFGATPVLNLGSYFGRGLLIVVVVGNLAVAVKQKSRWLLGLAVLIGLITTVVIGSPLFVFAGVGLLASLAVFVAVRYNWPGFLLPAIPACYLTHLLWAINRPWAGRPFQILVEPASGIFFLLLYTVILATGSFRRRDRSQEDAFTVIAVLCNCGFGFGLYLLTSARADPALFAPAHFAAAFVYLGLAVTFWLSEASRVSTFFYAMTGYLALSAAIAKVSATPEVFIWLSWQSLVVVTTALWFRSRLIVVANFIIYVTIVLTYMFLVKKETGISVGFGVVALLTARILNWKKERLELKTELMRNAYLASAFVVFPYALYHLVPRAYVSLAWISVAIGYYLMNFIIQNRKYRWMGHLTLLLTVAYVIVNGFTQVTPTYRIISFIVLGLVLLIVSLVFTQVRARRKRVLMGKPE